MGALADLRTAVAGALEAVAPPEWSVLPAPVDAISPPAFMLGWSDPWMPAVSTFCRYEFDLTVQVLAARIDPDPGLELLEEMVELALPTLEAAGYPVRMVSAPHAQMVGGISYQAATLTLSNTVTV